MSKIAVDIDDTLYPFAYLARETLAEQAVARGDKILERAAYAPWTEWRTPVDLLGDDVWMEIIDLCHQEEVILAQEPYKGSVELVTELAQTHEVVYISSRSEARYVATKEWLTNNCFPPGDLVCSGPDKRRHLAECQYLIDDRPRTLVSFVTAPSINGDPRFAFGLMTEFNRALTDVPNIYLAPPGNWKLLRHYFIKTGVLKENVYA